MATRSSILAWRSPQTEEPDGVRSREVTESDMTECLTQLSSDHFSKQVTNQDFQILSGQSHI